MATARRPRASGVHASARHAALLQIDPWTAWLWAPRTISVLVLCVAVLVHFSGLLSADRGSGGGEAGADDTKRGVYAAAALYLAFTTVQGSDTVLIRPHPAVWRLWHGVSVLYMLFLVFLLFQTPTGARLFLRHLSPSLGVELAERAYGADCRPVYANIRATVLDEFVVAHALGWWAKALILRHSGMLWVGSVLFEVLELTFQHLLPNFNECWWDRWLLDVLICNNFGIVTGMWTVRYFKAKKFYWLGLSQQPTLRAKVTRVAGQLLPWSFENFDWPITAGPMRCLMCLVPLAVMTGCELNAFFLKRVLWVPARNALNTCRLCIWVGMSLPAVKEYYAYISCDERQPVKLGTFAWLTLACIALETLVVLKVEEGVLLGGVPWPRAVRLCWSAGLAAIGAAWLGWAVLARRRRAGGTSSAASARAKRRT